MLGLRAVGVLVGSLAVGCSSSGSSDPYGATPDFTAIQSRFDTPTGTFAKGSENSVFGGYAQQMQNQSSSGIGSIGIGGVGASSSSGAGTIQAQALHVLGGGIAGRFCAALSLSLSAGQASGSCSCPSGGAIQWELDGLEQSKASVESGGPVDVVAKVRAAQCAVETEAVDGTEFAEMKSAGAPSANDLLMLLDVHLVATGTVALKVDADFEYVNGLSWASVSVNDGNVVVGSGSYNAATRTGTLVVRDRSDNWTCTLVNGTGTCTGQIGGPRPI
jgi:hypothetical protein